MFPCTATRIRARANSAQIFQRLCVNLCFGQARRFPILVLEIFQVHTFIDNIGDAQYVTHRPPPISVTTGTSR